MTSQASVQHRGFSIFGTIVSVVIIGILGLFGYKVWFYAAKIRGGEIIDLPQYEAKFTRTGENKTISSIIVDRDDVETADNPELGLEEDEGILTIVQFADFQCPYSSDTHTTVRRMMAKHGDKVRFIYRDYPLHEIHPDAYQASLAAECAKEQGLFWAYHDKLYANTSSLDFQNLLRFAKEVGMEGVQFETCLISERYKEQVDKDRADAEKFGLRGTPTFFFNGQKIEGAIPEQVFDRVITEMTQ